MWQLIRLTFRRWCRQEQRIVEHLSQAEGCQNISAQVHDHNLIIHNAAVRAEPSRAEPSRAEPSRAEPSRAEPSQVRLADSVRLMIPFVKPKAGTFS
jgi:predicted anti-sigma-YlaC factor YlaD